MSYPSCPLHMNRRRFIAGLAVAGGALAMSTGGGIEPAAAAPASLAKWRDRIGLQLFTVRDRFPADYAGTLRAVAGLGYKEVQPTLNYGGLSLDQVRRVMEENRLLAAATHVSPPNGAEFEPTLEAYARIGHRYTTVLLGPPRAPPVAGAAPPAVRPDPTPWTLEQAKRTAAGLNAAGRITKKHGLKVIIHNHTEEFEPLSDSPRRTPYDILIAETDPDLVALELDVGWASAAGADILELFRRAPGRFEVWHVKDIADIASLNGVTPIRRQRITKIVGMGQGDVDYRPIFAAADRAGLKHFYIEQDTAPATGDSIAAAGASYRYLFGLLV